MNTAIRKSHSIFTSWLVLVIASLEPFIFFIRTLPLTFLLTVNKIRLNLTIQILIISLIPVTILSFKRLIYTDYSAVVVFDLFCWFLISIFLIGKTIDTKVADRIMKFLIATFFLNYLFILIFNRPYLIWYELHGGDYSDLMKGFIFRNPGIFNEPSTYCYLLLTVYFFSSRSLSITFFTLITCILSTSIGGIIACLLLVFIFSNWRQRLYFIFLTLLMIGLIFFIFYEDGGYIFERVQKIIDGSDGSLDGRLNTVSEVNLTIFGMNASEIKDLYVISTVKSVGFVTNLYINLGVFGILWLTSLFLLLPRDNLVAKLALLTFIKFDLFSPAIWLLLYSRSYNEKD